MSLPTVTPGAPVRVLHVTTGLGTGGAETMLARLVRRLDRFAHEVVSLTDEGALGPELRAGGIPVLALGMTGKPADLGSLRLLVTRMRQRRPDVVVCWMYHANLVGGLAARLAGIRRVAWGIRHAGYDRTLKRRTALLARAGAWLSAFVPSLIIYNAEASRRSHEAIGYARDKGVVIPNGFDLRHLAPRPDARISVRQELGLSPDAVLLGIVARVDPAKDHVGFLEAARLVHGEHPHVHLVLVGAGTSSERLRDLVAAHGLAGVAHLLGPRRDVARLTAAFDIAVSSSVAEAFSNAIGEAMACGTPCVVTNVGDTAELVGDTGLIVPPRDPAALAAAVRTLLVDESLRSRLGHLARHRVEQRYSIETVAARFARILGDPIDDDHERPRDEPPSTAELRQ